MKSIKPSAIKGTLKAPASKSMMQRAIAAALLVNEPHQTTISNLTFSNDAKAAMSVIKGLGATITEKGEEIIVGGGMNPHAQTLNCGESGLGIRMFSPIASLWYRPLTLTGEGSLLKRPISMIEAPLQQLGVGVTTAYDYPPITVYGPLKGGNATVDGSISSQVLTGLLMALPKAQTDSQITVKNLKSKPYIDMTLSLLKHFNVQIQHQNYRQFQIAGNQSYRAESDRYSVEGDWSGAAFLMVAGALGGEVTVTGMNLLSPQADRKIIDALNAAGANVFVHSDQVEVSKGSLRAFEFDATHCPDLFPPLVALACHCNGTTVLCGVERLIHKESNRAQALEKEFTALGADIRISGNFMEIRGTGIKGGTIDSHNDHRIAMAGAVAAILSENPIVIQGSECVSKSYPAFFDDLQSIGGQIDE